MLVLGALNQGVLPVRGNLHKPRAIAADAHGQVAVTLRLRLSASHFIGACQIEVEMRPAQAEVGVYKLPDELNAPCSFRGASVQREGEGVAASSQTAARHGRLRPSLPLVR